MVVCSKKSSLTILSTFFLIIAIPLIAKSDTLTTWTQTTWHGGRGQVQWEDTAKFWKGSFVDPSIPGDLILSSGWLEQGRLEGAGGIYCLLRTHDGTLFAGTASGYLYRSTDDGTTWDTTGLELPGVTRVYSLLEASDSTLYAGTFPDGRVWKSTDGGVSWDTTSSFPNLPSGDHQVRCILEHSDGTLYAGTFLNYSVGKVFKSTDGGLHWDTTGNLLNAEYVSSIIEVANVLYAGAGKGFNWGRVFKSTDGGAHWDSCAPIPEATSIGPLLAGPDGTIYVGIGCGIPKAAEDNVWKSTDGGDTWEPIYGISYGCYSLLLTGDTLYVGTGQNRVYVCRGLSGSETTPGRIQQVWALLSMPGGIVYAGGGGSSIVQVVKYPGGYGYGNLESSVYHIPGLRTYGNMSWTTTLNGQTIVMRVRTSSDSLMRGAMEWADCDTVTSGQPIETLNSVNPGEKYIQYRVDMESEDPDSTPVLHSVSITYSTERIEIVPDSINFVYKKMILSIDDSTYSDWGLLDDPSWKEAVRLSVPSSASIVALWFYPVDPYGKNPPLQWRVWDDDGIPPGRPGTLLVSGDTIPYYNDWFKVPLDPPIPIDAGNLYVGWDAQGQGIWYGNGVDSQLDGYNWWWDGTTWRLDPYLTGDLMIRAEVILGALQDTATLGVSNISPEDSLEITDISYSSSWVDVTPTSFLLLPGEHLDVTVAVDGTYLPTGIYYDTLHILSDDPFNPVKEVVVEYEVKKIGVEEEPESKGNLNYFMTLIGPNPVGPSTTILYEIPKKEMVHVGIYNVAGQLVRTLVNELKESGPHRCTWDSRDSKGKRVSAGVYFCEFRTLEFRTSKKLVVLQ